MAEKLIFILPVVTLALYFIVFFYKGNNVQTSLFYIFYSLPLMNLKITKAAWGGFTTFDFICFFCFLYFFKKFIKTSQKNKKYNFHFLLFIILIVIIFLGKLASDFQDDTIFVILKTFPIFIFGRLFLIECRRDPQFRLKSINALKSSYVIALCFLITQLILGLRFTFYPILGPNTYDADLNMIRYPGIFYDSQANGQYLAIGSFLFLYFIDQDNKKRKIIDYSVFVFGICGIILTGSRAAFGGFTIGILVIFFLTGKKYLMYGTVIFSLAYLIYINITPQTGVFNRTLTLSQDYKFRYSLWKKTFDISLEHPFLGIGSGNYQRYTMKHARDQYLEISPGQYLYFDQPENGYLKILVELGFVGFVIFFIFLTSTLYRGYKLCIKSPLNKPIIFLLASLITWIVAFSTVYSIFDVRIFAIVVSIIVLILSHPSKIYVVHEMERLEE